MFQCVLLFRISALAGGAVPREAVALRSPGKCAEVYVFGKDIPVSQVFLNMWECTSLLFKILPETNLAIWASL